MTIKNAHLLIKLVLAVLALFTATFAVASSTPAFWQVSSGKAQVYLLGSMHFGHPDFFPLPATIEQAFNRSDILAVEVNVAGLSPLEITQAVYEYGKLEPGKSLKTELSDEVYRQLKTQGAARAIPVAALEQFQPWFIALQLVEAEIHKTALRQDLGIDRHFLRNANGKEIAELETLESQLRMFGDLSASQQESFLRQTLDDLPKSQTHLTELADAWKTGNDAQLERLVLGQLHGASADATALHHQVFTARNDAMVRAVEQFLEGDKSVFFVVGAGHMLGPTGILQQLSEIGHEVVRVPNDEGTDASIALEVFYPSGQSF